MRPERDVDVLVVGSGAAGLAAALSARENGARNVLIAESEGLVGGSSRLSGGLMMGAGTRYQRKLGIVDDADSLFHDYMQLNQWKVESAVVRRLAELSGPTVEWLGDLGVEYYDQLVFGGDEPLPRVHCPIGRGQAVVDVLARHCRAAGVEIALGRRVGRLLTDGGAVVGAGVGGDTLTAGAVVVATGGFGNNPEKLAQYFPSAADTGWAWYIGAPGSRGDHLDLAVQVGAEVTGYNRGLRLLHADFARIYEAYLPGWLVLVDRQGRRFCDETAPYGIMDGLIQEEGDVGYAIFDQTALDEATAAGVARYKQKVPGSTKKQSPHWNTDIVESMVAAGKVHRAQSVAELAAGFGLPAEHLEVTVERYNAAVTAGEDFDYLKDPKFLQPISTPPFYAAEIRPATVCFTACGLRIDRDARVIGESGRPIPGLFAAGESAGGVVGPRYVGSGNSYANCVTFGRVAGASAARLAMATPLPHGEVSSMSAVTAALISAKETVTFRTFTQAPPPPGCVTINITLCGICGTDIHSFSSGHLHSPAVCGHEWVGTVAATGAGVDGLQVGDRTVAAAPPACGRCPECLRGLSDYCRTASLVVRGRDPLAPPHGGFAGRITVQATRVMRAHPDLSDEVAAQVEPATVAFHGVRRSGITPGDTVVVQGAGPIGLLALQFARAAGAGDVLVIEPSPVRRRLATELGAMYAVAPGEGAEGVQDHTQGVGADVVIECTGVPRLLQTAVDLARSGGVVQLLSFLSEPATVNAARWLAKEVTVVASNAFTHDDVRRAMTFLADGRVQAEPLHSRTVRLDELEVTLRGLSAGPSDDIKVLVDPRQS